MRTDSLAVIVLNWNGAAVIGPCLDSLSRVERPPLSVIVVDNGSTDGSAATVRERYPWAELIENGENLLFAGGNNVGIRRALERGASAVLLLNNDTEVDPEFAERLLGAFGDPSTGIAGPRIYYHDDPRRIWYGGGDFHPLTGVPRHRDIRRLEGPGAAGAGETGWVTGCALLARREVFEQIGLLDPAYRIYCEDVDLCLRASRAGWRIRYEPAARVWHKVSSSSGGGMTPLKLESRLAGTALLMRRYRPLWWRILLAPVHAAAIAALAAGLLLTGRRRLLAALWRGAGRAAGIVFLCRRI
ncbi:MAG: glycosyltransferase family 2 protein [Candidatus Krumholzibacteria bacterium]|nr:glycosyltransferase family 2 protein [Candidatus Krumholzibacteria bacterium]